MTCAHVLGLIDAGPFADYPSAHLEAAWQHARQCATCGPALEAATALTTDLAGLARPAAPPDLTAAVLARIARIERPHPAPVAAEMPETTALSSPRDWSAWATAPGGLAAGLMIALSMASGDGRDSRDHGRSARDALHGHVGARPGGQPRALHGRAVRAAPRKGAG